MKSPDKYLIALSTFVPFGPVRIKVLLDYFEEPEKLWKAGASKLRQLGVSDKLARSFEEHKEDFDLEGYVERLKKHKIQVLTKTSKHYPAELKGLDNGPFALNVLGDVKSLSKNCIAIVGTRKMSSYGREVTRSFATVFSSRNLCVVSGLARGIDTQAHTAAILAGGKTVAVLGCGLNTIYPAENVGLAKKIIEKDGALISEYPLDYPALRANFANRNRIISGMAKAVVVVEGRAKSGTLLTATHAANQGKTVFAIPGPITSPNSQAPHFLLKNGARLATEPQDVLEDLGLQIQVDKEKIEEVLPEGPAEKKIYESLESGSLHLDEIVRITGLTTAEVSATLTIMEIKGLARSMGAGEYKRN